MWKRDTMKILVDENIPYGREAFESLGEVTTMAGRAIDATAVADCQPPVISNLQLTNIGTT